MEDKKEIYTIGFTKKDAKHFFDLIRGNKITLVIDVRLNNTSQLAGFAKYPDIKYFLNVCSNCDYLSDKNFAPDKITLDKYKKNEISWEEYLAQFNKTMELRNINKYIKENYFNLLKRNSICFLCSEDTAEHCHRRLIAEIFACIFDLKIINLR